MERRPQRMVSVGASAGIGMVVAMVAASTLTGSIIPEAAAARAPLPTGKAPRDYKGQKYGTRAPTPGPKSPARLTRKERERRRRMGRMALGLPRETGAICQGCRDRETVDHPWERVYADVDLCSDCFDANEEAALNYEPDCDDEAV